MNGSIRIVHPDTFQVYDLWSWVNKGVESSERLKISDELECDVPEIVIATSYSGMRSEKVMWSRENVYRRDNYTCQYCGIEAAKAGKNVRLTIDHILPQCKGGPNTFENTVAACSECNNWKDSMSVKEFCRVKGFKVPHPRTPYWHSWTSRLGSQFPDSWEKFIKN